MARRGILCSTRRTMCRMRRSGRETTEPEPRRARAGPAPERATECRRVLEAEHEPDLRDRQRGFVEMEACKARANVVAGRAEVRALGGQCALQTARADRESTCSRGERRLLRTERTRQVRAYALAARCIIGWQVLGEARCVALENAAKLEVCRRDRSLQPGRREPDLRTGTRERQRRAVEVLQHRRIGRRRRGEANLGWRDLVLEGAAQLPHERRGPHLEKRGQAGARG